MTILSVLNEANLTSPNEKLSGLVQAARNVQTSTLEQQKKAAEPKHRFKTQQFIDISRTKDAPLTDGLREEWKTTASTATHTLRQVIKKALTLALLGTRWEMFVTARIYANALGDDSWCFQVVSNSFMKTKLWNIYKPSMRKRLNNTPGTKRWWCVDHSRSRTRSPTFRSRF